MSPIVVVVERWSYTWSLWLVVCELLDILSYLESAATAMWSTHAYNAGVVAYDPVVVIPRIDDISRDPTTKHVDRWLYESKEQEVIE